MQTATTFPRQVKEIENIWIPMSDGVRLAARLWLPEDAEAKPVPAILEYLPYRKRDGTIVRDALTHPYFAGHGYASIRVDMRGNGDSEGLLFDEYTPQEQDDALEVIQWLTRQKWCSGTVGMIGISWGGFNGLQVAARQPPALKAVVTLCSTDDRYQDDIHYKGGCVINEHMAWAATMFAYSSRPPDPAIVGEAWRKMWIERLENQPMLIIRWLEHPHRDDYWKHASVCEDFGAIEAACLVVGGWNDAYSNAIPRLMTGLRASCKAIIGPWIHKYPHFSMVGPRIGFLKEALRWWDFWLKGEPTGVMRDPPYRIYVMDAIKPTDGPDEWPGRWIAEQVWNAGNSEIKQWYLNDDGIGGSARPETPLVISSPQDIGLDGGDYCIMFNGSGFPGNQVRDDAGSLTFDSPPLVTDMDIVGQPAIELDFSVDKPAAFVAVRLNDVWPSGEVTRITYQLQNLCQHESRETPAALEPGKRYRMKIALDDIAWRIPESHRLRVSISTSYWPLMWPAPESVTLTVHAGSSRVHVPVRRAIEGEAAPVFPPPEAAPEAIRKELEKPESSRKVWTDEATGETVIEERDDNGRYEIAPHGLIVRSAAEKTYRIRPDDPLSARMTTHWTEELGRGDWRTRIETYTRHEATSTHWIIWGLIEAFEDEEQVFRREWNEQVERKLN
jgi:putative CocE/NonD family hydrolase